MRRYHHPTGRKARQRLSLLQRGGQIANWLWIVISNICASGFGLTVLPQGPHNIGLLIGFVAGLNFLKTGIALSGISGQPKAGT